MMTLIDIECFNLQDINTESMHGRQGMKTAVRKWGNSASVRIPAAVMHAAHLNLDQEVDVREEGGVIIIEPVQRVAYDLAELLDGITGANLHREVSTGNPAGQEIRHGRELCSRGR